MDRDSNLATAREFNIPLYYVEINEICLEKDIEWFYVYEEEKESYTYKEGT